MIKKHFLFFNFFFFIQVYFGQVERQNALNITIKGPNTEIDGVTPEDASVKTQHIRFLTEDFKEVQVDTLNEPFYFRYNIFADEMEFIKNGTIYFLNKTPNQTVTFTDLNSTFKALNIDGKLNYLEIIETGKIDLYTKHNVTFIKGKVAKTQYESAKKSKFIRNKDTYYISLNSGPLLKLPSKKKEFIQIFGEAGTVMAKFIKKEKLSRKKIKDITKIIKTYNSL